MRLLSIDPGGMNGLCWWEGEDTHMVAYAHVKLEDLPEWLHNFEFKPDLIVYENFKLWKHRALQQSGSDLPAAQAIGMIKSYAKIYGILLVDQSPQILSNAQKMTQMKMPSDHSQSHWVSAYLHGMWYLIKNNLKDVVMAEADK